MRGANLQTLQIFIERKMFHAWGKICGPKFNLAKRMRYINFRISVYTATQSNHCYLQNTKKK